MKGFFIIFIKQNFTDEKEKMLIDNNFKPMVLEKISNPICNKFKKLL